MRIGTLSVAGLVALAMSVVPGAAGAQAPRDALRGFVCQPSVQPASRAISVESVMRPVSGTGSMEVRFELFRRPAGGAGFSSVSGTGLGRWLSPDDRSLGSRPGDVWNVVKPVVGLSAPATYRFRVSFRWLSRRHRVLATATQTTANCRQPELRPDLVIRRIAAPVPNKKRTLDRYTVTIANQGASAATAFAVALSTPGAGTVTRQVAGLAAHRTTQVTLPGPICSTAAPPVVTVDPYGQVDDFNRSNNVATVSCAAATTPF